MPLTEKERKKRVEEYKRKNPGVFELASSGLESPTAGFAASIAAEQAAQRISDLRNKNNITITGDRPMDIWARIYQIKGKDATKGSQLEQQANYFATQPWNPLYNPYKQATIPQTIKDFFGQDSFSNEWISANSTLLNYAARNASGSIKSPTEKSSNEEWAGYYYAQILNAETDTRDAEDELVALKKAVMEQIAFDKEIGEDTSVEDIINALEFDKNYKALSSLASKKLDATPTFTNRAIGFDKEDLYGMAYAAKQGKDITQISDFTPYSAGYAYKESAKKQYDEEYASLYNYESKLLEHLEKFEEYRKGPFVKKADTTDVAADTSSYYNYVDSITPVVLNSVDTQNTQRLIDKNLESAANAGTILAEDYAVYKENRDKGYQFWQLDPQTFDVLPFYSSPSDSLPSTDDGTEDSVVWQAKENYGLWQKAQLGVTPWDDLSRQARNQAAGTSMWSGAANALLELNEATSAANAYFADNTRKNPRDKRDSAAEVAYIESNPEEYYDTFYEAYKNVLEGEKTLTKDQKMIADLIKNGAGIEDIIHVGPNNWTTRDAITTQEDAARHRYDMVDVLRAFGATDEFTAARADVMARSAVSEVNSVQMQTGNWLVDHVINSAYISAAQMIPRIALNSVVPGLGSLYSGLNWGGQSAEEARQAGVGKDARIAFGGVVGLINSINITPFERANGSTGLIGKALNSIPFVKKLGSSAVGGFLVNLADEIVEENTQDFLQNLSKLLIYDHDMKFYSSTEGEDALINPNNILDTTLSTALTTAAMDGVPTIGKAITNYAWFSENALKGNASILVGREGDATTVVADGEGKPFVVSEEEAKAVSEASNREVVPADVTESETVKAAKRKAALNNQEMVDRYIPDQKIRDAIYRTMDGNASEEDLDILSDWYGIPVKNYNDIQKAAKEVRAKYDAFNKAAEAYDDYGKVVLEAEKKYKDAVQKLGDINTGIAMMREGNNSLGQLALEYQSIQQELASVQMEADQIEAAGSFPNQQNQRIAELTELLKESKRRYDLGVASLQNAQEQVNIVKGHKANLDEVVSKANALFDEAEERGNDIIASMPLLQEAVGRTIDEVFRLNFPMDEDYVSTNPVSADYDGTNASEIEAEMKKEAEIAKAEAQLEEEAERYAEEQARSEMYEGAKEYLRGTKIRLSDTQKQEAAYRYEKYGNYTKRFFGTGITFGDDGVPLDNMWEELSSAYPELFPADTSEVDQVNVLLEARNRIYEKSKSAAPATQTTAPATESTVGNESAYEPQRGTDTSYGQDAQENNGIQYSIGTGTDTSYGQDAQENDGIQYSLGTGTDTSYGQDAQENNGIQEENVSPSLSVETPVIREQRQKENQKAQENNGIQEENVSPSLSVETPVIRERRQKENQKVASYQQAIENSAKEMGFGLQLGGKHFFRNKGRGVRGYTNYENGVNVRSASDIRTFSHEAGHVLDERHDLVYNNRKSVDAMVDRLDPNFTAAYRMRYQDAAQYEAVIRREAVAEFVRMYITNPVQARAFSGREFFNNFEESLTKTEKASLSKLRNAYSSFMSADVSDQIGATIVGYADKEKKSAKQIKHDIQTRVSDLYTPLRVVDEAIRKKLGVGRNEAERMLGVEGTVKNAMYAAGVADNILINELRHPITHDAVYVQGGMNSLTACFAGLKGNDDINTLIRYMKAKHAMDWAAQGKAVFDEDVDYVSFVNEIEKNRPDIVTAQQNYTKYWKAFMQAWCVDTGLLSQSELNAMFNLNPNYVPNIRKVQSSSGNGRSVNDARTVVTQRSNREGSTYDTYDPIESIILKTQSIVKAVMDNQVYQALDEAYQTIPNFKDVMMLANPDRRYERINLEQVLNRALSETLPNAARNDDEIRDIIDRSIDNVLDIIGSRATNRVDSDISTAPQTINVIRNDGTVVSYEIKDKGLYNSLMETSTASPAIVKAMQALSRSQSALLTAKNFLRFARNMAMDTGKYYIMSVNGPIAATKNLLKAYGTKATQTWWGKGVFKKNSEFYDSHLARIVEAYNSYLAFGAGSDRSEAGNKVNSLLDIKKDIFNGFKDKNWVKDYCNFLSRASDALFSAGTFIEDATRYAEYLNGLERYGTDANGKALSFRRSRTVTTEFAVTGKWTKGLSAFFRFANANIQGTTQDVRMLTDSSTGNVASRWARLFGFGTVAGVVAELIARSLWKKPEEYDEISESIRLTHWCFPNPFSDVEGSYIRIPKPQGPVFAVFNGIPQAITAGFLNGDLEDELQGALENVWDSVNPFGSPISSPISEARTNKTYYGTKIVSEYMEDLPLSQQYSDTTSQWAVRLGDAINAVSVSTTGKEAVSPAKLEYVLEQYGGGAMQLLGSIVNGVAEDGLAGGFTAALDKFARSLTINPYYTNDEKVKYSELKEQLEKVKTEYSRGNAPSQLSYQLTDKQMQDAIIELEKLLGDEEGKGVGWVDSMISSEWDAIMENLENESLSDDVRESMNLEHRKNILEYQVLANEAMQSWLDTYGPEGSLRQYTESRAKEPVNRAETEWRRKVESLPDTFAESDDEQIKALKTLYGKAIESGESTSNVFMPTWPPTFTNTQNDSTTGKAVTPWDDVSEGVKEAMEKAWYKTLVAELKAAGVTSDMEINEKNKKKVSSAKSKATAAARAVYERRYKFVTD